MSNIKILDCTLRDGGYVNQFDFGIEPKINIAEKLSKSKVDIIELGFLKNGSHKKTQSLYNDIDSVLEFIPEYNNKNKQLHSLMIRPDWYDINLLNKTKDYIQILRFAFHYKDIDLTIHQANIARKLGFEIFLNPVNITSYSDKEIIEILKIINDFKPEGACIVDTFGSLLPKRFNQISEFFVENLDDEITIGLHLHENLSLSMGLVAIFLEKYSNRKKIVIDSSLNGMGRIPGNLPTELILGMLNEEYSKTYDINLIIDSISDFITPIKQKFNWGYIPDYGVSAFNKVHRSFPEFFINKGLTLSKSAESIRNLLADGFGNEFNEETASKYL